MIHYFKKNENYDEIIKSKLFSILVFKQENCGPCIMLEPIMAEVANDKKVDLFFFDINLEPSYVKNYNVNGTPTTLFFKNGKEIQKEVGFGPYEKWVGIIENYNK